MIPYMVGKLASNSLRLTRGLVKYVPGRGYFRAVSSQNRDKFVTSPPPLQSLNGSSMKEYIARAKSLTFNVQYYDIEVSEQEISRRVLNGLPPSYAIEKRNFTLKPDFSLAELKGGLVREEELNRSSDETDGSHALAAGFEARTGGRSGGPGGHNGGGHGKRGGKGRPPNQRQPQHQPRYQREQQPAHQPQQQQY